MISKDQLKYALQIIKNNVTLRNYFIFFLISYCGLTNIYLPETMIIFLNQPISKMVILLVILYLAQKDMILSILMTFALLLTINLKQTLDLSNALNKENFTTANDDDDSDSDDDNDSDDNDSDKDNSDDNDSDNESQQSDSSDENLEKYTQNHPELSDGFTKLHNAIHDYENYMNK